MVFLVVDTDIYDLLLGLYFFMKLETIMNVEKIVIQICNGLEMEVEVLPLNMVNMLWILEKSKEENNKIQKKLFNVELEHIQLNV